MDHLLSCYVNLARTKYSQLLEDKKMTNSTKIPVLKVNQWLHTWNQAEWSEELPEPTRHFFMASMKISTLRRLSGVSRRQVSQRKAGSKGAGYQRAHQETRSKSIAQYLRYGYPLSSQLGLKAEEHRTLIHPGWLPTAILVNIVASTETRRRNGKDLAVDPSCAVTIVPGEGVSFLSFPSGAEKSDFSLPATSLEPIEIIDGQHRLFALDEMGDEGLLDGFGDYEVPVIVFDGLSEAWQAYLFWVINVEPKKINPSLAFDLYPELRSQSWLESGEGIKVYQEHRAQELTEVLWRHEDSPWRDRIELHGNRVEGHVSNAAFIRSLTVSYVRRWGRGNKVGGLFGSVDRGGKERVLRWKRSQQAAFLIACWRHVHNEIVRNPKVVWIAECAAEFSHRPLEFRQVVNPHGLHAAFAGPDSLLGTDQGARAIMVVFNAVCQVAYAEMELETWESERVSDAPEDSEVSEALAEFNRLGPANSLLKKIAAELVIRFDWRASSAASLTSEQKQMAAAFRGSSGYAMLQRQCLTVLTQSTHKDLAAFAKVAYSSFN